MVAFGVNDLFLEELVRVVIPGHKRARQACGGYPYVIKSLRIKSRRGISLLLYKRILSLPLKKMYVICPYFS